MVAPIVRRMLFVAARRLATDPQMRALALEIFHDHVRPRAAAAWQNAKPRITETRADLARIAEQTNVRRHPVRFAGRAARRIIVGVKPQPTAAQE